MTKQSIDHRGSSISGATDDALDAFESALVCVQSWRGNPQPSIDAALAAAPQFVMAHVLDAYLHLCSREASAPANIAAIVARASQLPANERERLHLSALNAAVNDDLEEARASLQAALAHDPRDVIALHAGQALDYLTGECECMLERTQTAMPAWNRDMPGYPSILAMHAFALEEAGAFDHAEAAAQSALELEPLNVRAHHVLAHVYEMTGRARMGIDWMEAHRDLWIEEGAAATHCWWHMALLHLQEDDLGSALRLYDERVRSMRSGAVADMIDASALLWRLSLLGADVGNRWLELADAWAPHIEDRYCTFSDLHAMLAFVGACDWRHADSMLNDLRVRQALRTRYGEMTREVGLPACRALIAFGKGDYATATALLASLPAIAHRLGGSHAQRDIVHLTLLEAVERTRKAPWRWSVRVEATMDHPVPVC